MIRKLNYTGRKKIKHSSVVIETADLDHSRSFNARVDFTGYNLPGDARVYIEPYYRLSFMRFDCGTVGHFSVPLDTELKSIPYSDIIYFRIKVVDENGTSGRLLAFADKIRPLGLDEGQEQNRSILPVDYRIDLGQQVWKVSFTGPVPVLHINSQIENGRTLVQSHEFYALVLPSVIREIMNELLRECSDDEADEDHWTGLWLRYVKVVLRVNDKPNAAEDMQEDQQEWVDEVVGAFCRQNMILRRHLFRTNLIN